MQARRPPRLDNIRRENPLFSPAREFAAVTTRRLLAPLVAATKNTEDWKRRNSAGCSRRCRFRAGASSAVFLTFSTNRAMN
jgi:hypothetical protein